MSRTGNTRKVAETIYSVIPQPKEIKRVEDVTSLEGYDLSFLGFPIHDFGPDKQAKTFLETHVKDRSIALFMTHMAPENAKSLRGWSQRFGDAAVGANIVGVFNCQGQCSRRVKFSMRVSSNPRLREWARADSSQGQPDAVRLERARTFAKETVNKL